MTLNSYSCNSTSYQANCARQLCYLQLRHPIPHSKEGPAIHELGLVSSIERDIRLEVSPCALHAALFDIPKHFCPMEVTVLGPASNIAGNSDSSKSGP